jgi:hypothetical protein
MNRNRNYRRVETRFGPDTRFTVPTVPVAPFRALLEDELELLKGRLLRQRLNETGVAELHVRLRRAANDAAALAWATSFPLLVFPELFAEKAGAALKQARRQAEVRERSREILLAA